MLKRILVILFILIELLLIAATIINSIFEYDFSSKYIYSSPWFVAIWTIFSVCGIFYMYSVKLHKRFITFTLHLSFILILIGALVTWLFAQRGQMHVREGARNNIILLDNGYTFQLPFSVYLNKFYIVNYRGTSTPLDFVSDVVFNSASDSLSSSISMNNIASFYGYRFYQADFDDDERGAIFRIAYDPWGIGITYAGYFLLLLSILFFFFDKKSHFRKILQSSSFLLIAYLTSACSEVEQPKAVQQDVAREFGKINILYNGRICPLQTFAIDFTTKLYGRSTYKNLSAEQVLCSWMFYFDDWKNEKMILVKNAKIRSKLNLDNEFTSFSQLIQSDFSNQIKEFGTNENQNISECIGIINMLHSNELLRINPIKNNDILLWHSISDKISNDTTDDYNHIRKLFNFLNEQIIQSNNEQSKKTIEEIIEYQQNKAYTFLPSQNRINIERLYNISNFIRPTFILCLTLGFILFVFYCIRLSTNAQPQKATRRIANFAIWLIFTYLTYYILLRWIISSHIPLSNGPETLQFLAWCTILLTLFIQRHFFLAQPLGLLIAGLTLLVSTIGSANPQITQLMPVLTSPLLSLHVAIIMIAYSLLAFMMLNGVVAIILYHLQRDCHTAIAYLYRISYLMLYPAVFCLAIGIFIGAVWANISWGRYWGWDPKEVWALITFLLYSIPFHSSSLPFFQRHITFHRFCIFAFISVLITYFGVNFILGGMHSYAQ